MLKLRLHGVLRCCSAAIQETYDARALTEKEGAIYTCRYCKGELVYREGAWEWEGAERLRKGQNL
jgi:hypothetical protein